MRWFITGTDTNVGKTELTACLAAAARQVAEVVAAKPVASGVCPGTAGEDAERLADAAGHAPLVHTTFEAPLSPHRAAREEGRALDRTDLLRWVAALQAWNVLVEGVGGWRVPLGDGLWVRDLAIATGGPVVVVAADRLGCLNHTLLTVQAIRADGLTVAGVVLNQGIRPHPDDRSTATNRADLAELLDVPVAVLPATRPRDRAALGAQIANQLHMVWSRPDSGEE